MSDLIDVRELQLERWIWAAAPPSTVYQLIGDVSAMAAWSPDLMSAQYDDGDGPWVGSWFTGLNRDENHDHPWQTRVRITEAEPRQHSRGPSFQGTPTQPAGGTRFRPATEGP